MLAPHDGKDAQLGKGGRAAQDVYDTGVFFAGEAVLQGQVFINLRLLDDVIGCQWILLCLKREGRFLLLDTDDEFNSGSFSLGERIRMKVKANSTHQPAGTLPYRRHQPVTYLFGIFRVAVQLHQQRPVLEHGAQHPQQGYQSADRQRPQ